MAGRTPRLDGRLTDDPGLVKRIYAQLRAPTLMSPAHWSASSLQCRPASATWSPPWARDSQQPRPAALLRPCVALGPVLDARVLTVSSRRKHDNERSLQPNSPSGAVHISLTARRPDT